MWCKQFPSRMNLVSASLILLDRLLQSLKPLLPSESTVLVWLGIALLPGKDSPPRT